MNGPFWAWVEFVAPIFREVTVGLAALTGSIVAWLGLDTWQRQLRGQADHEVSGRILKAAYNVRDVIAAARESSFSKEEYEKAWGAVREEAGTPTSQIEDEAFERRQVAVRQAMSALRVESVEGEALWGTGAVDFHALEGCVDDLVGAISLHRRYHYRPRSGDDPARLIPVEDVVWCTNNRGDEFRSRVDSAVEQVVASVRPRLRRPRVRGK